MKNYIFLTQGCYTHEWEFTFSRWSFSIYNVKGFCLRNLAWSHKNKAIYLKENQDFTTGCMRFARTKQEKTRIRTQALNQYRRYITQKGYKVIN